MSISTTSHLDHLFKQSNCLSLFKQALNDQTKRQRAIFDPQKNVGQLLVKNAENIDNILTSCWKHFLKEKAEKLCLVATGGYGRSELFPNSDIDILIILEQPDTSCFADNLTTFSNFLWDIGLKPGQSVRTIEQCIEAARDDQTVMTSLLEVRQITGSDALFSDLIECVSKKHIWPSDQFFAAKMQEQEKRYLKYHDTAYNLEPNIKEGPGGLRDLQNIMWVFKHHYKTPTFRELIKYEFLSVSEYDELISARDILWRIRFALHTLTNRCEDRLQFNHQRELASQFGFTHDDSPDVEQFMQFYFKTVMELERMNEMLLQLFSEKFIDVAQTRELQPPNKHFVSINGFIEAKDKNIFKNHPIAFLEIFLLLQQNPSLKGIRASTIRLIRKNLHLIDDDFRHHPKANQTFLALFKSPQGITHQFQHMNRFGILAAYLPCFANIVARMQYDLFHIYTVDAHTLFVLRNLRRFSLDKHNDELPFCNSVFLRITKPAILYIAAIFHDIAKGMGGDHSVLGEKIADKFCIQHKLSKHDRNLVTWLVRNHLNMSMTAQRKDISDPEVIHKFALKMGSIEYLNHLYLLTVADIRATNPSLWNSWKDSLLRELYTATHSALHRGLQNPIARSQRLYDNKQEAKDELIGLGISETTTLKTWEQINDDYFLRYSADEIAWHTIAIASSNKKDRPLVILRPQNQRGSVEIFVYTKNEKNIFCISADTLDHLGLTILDARISTINTSKAEQYVLNGFQVLEKSGEPIKDLFRELNICKTLKNNLKNLKVKRQVNIHGESRQAKHFPINTRIYFHKDPLSRYTIIELITTDCSGLLATIGQAFNDLDIQLHEAKITTIGSRVEDMFYVTDLQMQTITDENQLEKIKAHLISILQN